MRTPEHWHLTHQEHSPSSRDARAALMQMYVTGSCAPAKPSKREWALRLSVSAKWVLVQLLAVAIDLATLLAHIADVGVSALWASSPPSRSHAMKLVFLSLAYSADVGLRVYGLGTQVFFSKCWNRFDAAIVVLTIAGAIQTLTESAGHTGPFRLLRLLRVFRILRVIRIAVFVSHALPRCCQRMRRITGENKRRFVSLEEDFDLDLVYITPRLLSMSVPADGWLMQFYRNPLSEVVRFFETFHPKSYLIINACPEIPYNEAAFRTGTVERFDVKDHRPPPLTELLRFLEVTQGWTKRCRQNVTAVHCRGGKGRTGSFCCSWLLYTKEAEDAEDALNFFALRRTDLEKKRLSKVQGVETPSQVRYVGYVDRLLREQMAYLPSLVSMPRLEEVLLASVQATKFFTEQFEMLHRGHHLVAVVQDASTGRSIASALGQNDGDAKIWHFGEARLSGDVGLIVYTCHPDGLPVDKEQASALISEGAWQGSGKRKLKEAFGCFFHVNFLDGDVLEIPATETDQACKRPELFCPKGVLNLVCKRA